MELKTLMMSRMDPNSEFYVPKEEHEQVQIKGVTHGMQRVDGHLIPNLCRNLSLVKSMDVRADDTFVVTYPKSGTNWVSEICWLIQNNSDFERSLKESHILRTCFIDMGFSNEFLNRLPSPRVFQSHLRRCFLPDNIENRAKVVYVVRNPKDVLVSLYFFLQSIPEDRFEGTLEELFDEYVNGQVMYGGYCEHINEFAKLNNIHFVHYEDLLEDGLNEMRKLAKFLGKDLSDEQLKQIVDFCSFDSLNKKKVFEVKIPDGIFKEHANGGEQDKKVFKLLRKGQIGDWKNYFNDEMSKTIDEMVASKLEYKKPIKFEPTKN